MHITTPGCGPRILVDSLPYSSVFVWVTGVGPDSTLNTCSGYLFGVVGTVIGTVGGVRDQDIASRHNAEGPHEPVYRCADDTRTSE